MQVPLVIVNASLHAALFAAVFFAIARLVMPRLRSVGRVRLAHHLPGHLAQLDLQRLRSRFMLLLATGWVAALTFVLALFLEPPYWMQQANLVQHLALQSLVSVVALFFVARLARSFLRLRQQTRECELRVEIGVALAAVFSDGAQVFHDVTIEGSDQRIGDVLLGPSGIFVVQTIFKTGHSPQIKLVADTLVDANENLVADVLAWRYQVRGLQQQINRHCSPPLKIRRVLVVPGAQVCEQANPECLLLSESHLSVIRGWTEPSGYLLDEQVESVRTQLSRRPKTAWL